ncbi:hypothetical protein HDU93_001630 [Gonapodya sp. JEL0774]|nr:hypothetical protein HDU93_001630 [Gonapodya sp. JEL0774]
MVDLPTTDHFFFVDGHFCLGFAFPGTHNSYAVGDALAANQKKDIKTQLADGIRMFELDLHWKAGVVELCHTQCDNLLFLDAGPLSSALTVFKTFLDANPNEVVVITYENYDNVPAQQVATLMSAAGLVDYAYTGVQGATTWPTLADLISQNKRLVVFTDQNVDYASYPCHHAVSTPISGSNPRDPNIVYVPTTSSVATTNSYSNILLHVATCNNLGYFPNFLRFDYYDQGDVFRAVDAVNGVEGQRVGGYKSSSTSTTSAAGATSTGSSGTGATGTGTGKTGGSSVERGARTLVGSVALAVLVATVLIMV